MDVKSKYDVIIIGAGMGGLMCGGYLAKSGMKILIVEKNDKVGGCITSTKVDGYTIDMGAHLIGGCRRNGLFDRYLKDLCIDVDFIEPNPVDRFYICSKKFDVPSDMESYITILQNMFPSEQEAIEKFFKNMLKVFRGFFGRYQLDNKYQDLTYKNYIESFFKKSKLSSILGAHSGIVGLPPHETSFVAMSLLMVSYIRDGMCFVKGGTQNLPNKICDRIRLDSGEVMLGTEAKEIMVDKNKAIGVVTSKGTFFADKGVVSNIDTHKTLIELIGVEKLPKEYISKILKLKKGPSIYFMHLVVDIDDHILKSLSGWRFKKFACKINSMVYFFVPSLFDKSILPKIGTNLIQSFMFVPNNIAKQSNWNKIGANYERKILSELEQILNLKLNKRILIKLSSTPKDIEKFTGNSDGSISGWEMSPAATFKNRLECKTPIKNLYMTGHWTNPGFGVLGTATSGKITSRTILEKYNGK